MVVNNWYRPWWLHFAWERNSWLMMVLCAHRWFGWHIMEHGPRSWRARRPDPLPRAILAPRKTDNEIRWRLLVCVSNCWVTPKKEEAVPELFGTQERNHQILFADTIWMPVGLGCASWFQCAEIRYICQSNYTRIGGDILLPMWIQPQRVRRLPNMLSLYNLLIYTLLLFTSIHTAHMVLSHSIWVLFGSVA